MSSTPAGRSLGSERWASLAGAKLAALVAARWGPGERERGAIGATATLVEQPAAGAAPVGGPAGDAGRTGWVLPDTDGVRALGAALAWAGLVRDSDELRLYQEPQLDILSYFPAAGSLSAIDAGSLGVMERGMALPPDEALFVATYTVDAAALAARGHVVEADVARGRILRSVLMKPETEAHVPALHRQVLDLLG